MKEFPKVLIAGVDAWRKDGPSDTLPNIFSCWDKEKVALVYTRSNNPDSDVSNNFFQISENKVLKSIFRPWIKTGKTAENHQSVISKDLIIEQKRYGKAHKKHSEFMTLCREIVWLLGNWKSKELRDFVNKFNPDVLFLPIYNKWYMCSLELFLIRITKKPIATYYVDDDYSYDSCQGILSYLHRFVLRKYVKKLMVKSRESFVIADMVKNEIDKTFNKDSKILTKGVDFTTSEYSAKKIKYPIKFVYTGNLLIGRDSTLLLIADIINKLDNTGEKISLDIYSQTELSENVLQKLNNGNSHFHGNIPREKIEEIQKNADVLIFAEAISGKNSYAAKMSFSTKLTDYMKSGKCIFAVGKQDISPIHYLKKYDAAIVSTNEQEIYENIKSLLEEPKLIENYGSKAFNCAKQNHDKESIDKRFCTVLFELWRSNYNGEDSKETL